MATNSARRHLADVAQLPEAAPQQWQQPALWPSLVPSTAAPTSEELEGEALRLRRLMIEHHITATTELFRQARMDELDDSVIQTCQCGWRYVPPSPCPACGQVSP